MLRERTVLEEGMYRNLWNPSKYRTKIFGKDSIKLFDKMDAPVETQNIEAYHRLKSDNNDGNKIIAKFNKRKDMVRVMSKKKFLKKC